MTKRFFLTFGLLAWILVGAQADRWRMLPFLENIFRNDTLAADSLENGLERLVCIAQMSDDKGVIRTDIERQDEYSAWRLIPTGERSRYSGQSTFYIQNVGTGRYISGVGATSLGQGRAWQWVLFPGVRDSLYAGYPKICHFVEEGDSLIGYPPKDSLFRFQYMSLIEFYTSKGYDDYIQLIDSINGTSGFEESYVVGAEPGEIPQLLHDRLKSSYNTLLSLSTDLEDAVYAEAVAQFRRDKQAADSAAADVKNGYYLMERQRTVALPGGQVRDTLYERIYSDGGFLCNINKQQEELYFTADSLPKSIFYIENRGNGRYHLRCLYDSLYVVPVNNRQQIVTMSASMPEGGFRFEAWRSGLLFIANDVQQGDDRFAYYLISTGNNGTNRINHYTVYNWRPGGERFRLRTVAASVVDSLRRASVQTRRDERLSALKTRAAQMLRQTIVYVCDTLHPVVTRAEQFDCNALTTSTYGRDLGALIDARTDTRIITQSGTKDSVFSTRLGRNVPLPDAPHYLQITTDDVLPDSVLIKWTLAYQTSGAPTGVRLLRSRDGSAWEAFLTLQGDEEQFPTTRQSPHYTSPLIEIGAGYRFLRMEVTDNAGHTTDMNGHPNMVLAEFNLYPVNGIDPRSQGLRPEVEQASLVLKEAVATAQALAPREANDADLNTLQRALDGLLSVWADTTRLDSLMVLATHYEATASVGTDIGQSDAAAIEALRLAKSRAADLRPFYCLTRRQVDAAATELEQAVTLYQAQINMPVDDECFFVVSASTGIYSGRCITVRDYDYAGARSLSMQGTPQENEQNALGAWRFVRLGEANLFAVQNIATGMYLGQGVPSDTIVPIRLVLLNPAQFALYLVESNKMVSAVFTDGGISKNDEKNSAAWTITPVDHERMTDIKHLHPNAAQVVCVPYRTTQLPSSLYATMDWYEPIGLQADGDGKLTGLALRLTPDETLTPGKPYVLVMGASSESDDEDLAVDMCMDIDQLEINTVLTPNNGLRGTLTPLRMTTTGFAYFDRSDTLCLTTDTAEVLIALHTGYFSLAALSAVKANEAADLVLPLRSGLTMLKVSDHNGDGWLNLPDAVLLINRIVIGQPDALGRYDHNADGRFNLPDAVKLIEMMTEH